MDFSQLPPEILAQLQGAGGGPAGGPATLIKLRAGRCVREGTTVTADPSKGWVEVRRVRRRAQGHADSPGRH